MLPSLAALIAIQQLDTAAEAARRRLSDMPGVEQELDAKIAAAAAAVQAAKTRLTDNQHARRELEKQVAAVDTRLTRFDEHKAAVKTNQEYTALLHEIATAKAEKDAVEEKILVLLEAADVVAAEIKTAETALADAKREVEAAKTALGRERHTLEEELARLTAARKGEAVAIDAPVLIRYEQILKQRRMLAVAPINGELCTACHVRMRPAVAQLVRRNDAIIFCDSCQRILYFVPKAGE